MLRPVFDDLQKVPWGELPCSEVSEVILEKKLKVSFQGEKEYIEMSRYKAPVDMYLRHCPSPPNLT